MPWRALCPVGVNFDEQTSAPTARRRGESGKTCAIAGGRGAGSTKYREMAVCYRGNQGEVEGLRENRRTFERRAATHTCNCPRRGCIRRIRTRRGLADITTSGERASLLGGEFE